MITSYRLAFTNTIMAAFRPRGAPARWNTEGNIMVYSSEHVALSALEILISWEIYPQLNGYHLFSSSFNEKHLAKAPEGTNLSNKTASQAYGDTWLEEASSIVLKVPSVVTPLSYNYLLNPNHPNFYQEVKLDYISSFSFDTRVKRLIASAKEGSK